MGFFVQFEINFLLRVFQKAEIALSEAASAISPFWEKLIRANYFQTDSKPYDCLIHAFWRNVLRRNKFPTTRSGKAYTHDYINHKLL